jgi:hypothetical protein
MKGIVLALVLHTQMCPQCTNGETCCEGERLHDKWFDHVMKAALGTEDRQGVPLAA